MMISNDVDSSIELLSENYGPTEFMPKFPTFDPYQRHRGTSLCHTVIHAKQRWSKSATIKSNKRAHENHNKRALQKNKKSNTQPSLNSIMTTPLAITISRSTDASPMRRTMAAARTQLGESSNSSSRLTGQGRPSAFQIEPSAAKASPLTGGGTTGLGGAETAMKDWWFCVG